jgi:hypothetical protein
VIGGLAYLVAVLWLEPWMALVLSVSGLVFSALLRLRGTSALAGCAPPVAPTARSSAIPPPPPLRWPIGWFGLHDQWLAFTTIAFTAWGDASAGLLRGWLANSRLDAVGAAAAMLTVSVGWGVAVLPDARGIRRGDRGNGGRESVAAVKKRSK